MATKVQPQLPIKHKKHLSAILAMGADSAGSFAFYKNSQIFLSKNFDDLSVNANFKKYQKAALNFVKKNGRPDMIITDLHPLFNSSRWGKELSKKWRIPIIQTQHQIAHACAALGEYFLTFDFSASARAYKRDGRLSTFDYCAIVCDGTGYGLDSNIWGGEILKLQVTGRKLQATRIGHLEEQIMLGGEAAVKEPARMLVSILDQFSIFPPKADQSGAGNFQFSNKEKSKLKNRKQNFIYQFVKKFYTKNEFEVLYNQLEQNFNCQLTSSTGRILDAVACLLFGINRRNYKHEATKFLAKHSTTPYNDLKPIFTKRYILHATCYMLMTTPLFQYLIKNINRDKKRLAATAQLYIAQGLWQIAQKTKKNNGKTVIVAGGGLIQLPIIKKFLKSKGVFINEKISPGDEGVVFGQIWHYLIS